MRRVRAYRTAAVLDSSQEFQRYLITTGILFLKAFSFLRINFGQAFTLCSTLGTKKFLENGKDTVVGS